MLLNLSISLFKNVRDKQPTTVTLGKFLRSTRHIPLIEAVRACPDKAARQELKKGLPAVTISGTFDQQRLASQISLYNGLVCLDFDADDNPGYLPADMKAILCQYAEVAYAGLSVSGAGVYAIIPTDNTDPKKHADTTRLVGRLFQDEGLGFDVSCTDVSRLRYISHDPAPVWNADALPFQASRHLPSPQPARAPMVRDNRLITGDTIADRVERRLQQIEARALDCTGVYNDWYRLGFALSSEFGPLGEEYFQRVSQFHPKYDRPAVAKFYAGLCAKSARIQIGTFFHLTTTAAQ